MEPLTLASNSLTVILSPPGEVYTGPRFDWTTQVQQVVLGGHSFLTQEKEGDPSLANQGRGLAGEFGIDTAVGYTDCPVGGLFPKIGVGLLQRPDEAPYRFNRPYDILPARFKVRPEGPAALLVTADQSSDRGYGWFLKRHWSVRGNELTLSTTLANTGSKPLSTEEYIHNFFGLNAPVGPGWVLSLPGGLSRSDLTDFVDPQAVLAFGDRVTWTTRPDQEFFWSDRRSPAIHTWTLSGPDGLTVTETVDFPILRFNLWGRGHVVSPELYRSIEVAPGASAAWTRRWAFDQTQPR